MNIAENISDTKIRFGGFSTAYKEYKLGDITDTISRPLKMDNEKEYLLVTVKRRNEGIVERGIYKGKEVKVKSQFKIEAGDFLISKRQIIHGACEIVPSKLAGAIVSNEYHILHGKTELLLTEYLNLLSKTPKLKNYFALACVGVDIEKMLFRIEDWKKRVIKIPSIEEQQKIISFFNLLNSKLKKQQEKIVKLEQYKKGIMQKIFSQELRFKDEDGGEFREWKKQKLNKLADSLIGLTYSPDNVIKNGEGVLVLRSSNIKNSMLSFNDNVYVNVKIPKRLFVKKGDILLCSRNGSRQLIGKSALIDIEMPNVTFGAFMALIRSNEEQFVYQLLQSEEFYKQIHENLGATINQITTKDLKQFEFMIPTSIEERKKIGEVLSEFDKKIKKENEKLLVLEEQKKGFMQGIFV